MKRLILALLLLAALPLRAAEIEIPGARDLQADAREAERRGVAILLAFSAEACPYCDRLEENILRPMLIGGLYDDKVVVRKVMLDGDALRDFDGKRVSPGTLAARYRARLTPTVVLVDARGKALAPRILGINTIDYYWEQLDGAIDEALAALRSEKTLAKR